MKKSFLLYFDLCEIFNELTDEQSGILIKEIVNYAKSKNPNEPKKPSGLNGLMNAVFTPFKNHIDRDLQKYKSVVERNINNGKKGGRPKTKTQNNPKKADSVNDKDNDKPKKKTFTPPTFEQLNKFVIEDLKEYNLDSKQIFNYYNDADWHDATGKPVKSWKQKIRGVWCKPENKVQPQCEFNLGMQR